MTITNNTRLETIWDRRYDTEEFVYGVEPNDFLVEAARYIPAGSVLCTGEGEGRNAVFLAGMGYDVTALDQSRVGLSKALRLATANGVVLNVEHTDIAEYEIEKNHYSAIVEIFNHYPQPLRSTVHRRIADVLPTNGVFILEAYTPEQLLHKTGGPPTEERLYRLDDVLKDVKGLEILHAVEKERDVREGRLHHGRAAVMQLVARKR
ncbi:methyltransferase domain-containing protein [bacterium]|nr:methyltransferase domain-containing protein [bacterium]